jgi:hypothetical protein
MFDTAKAALVGLKLMRGVSTTLGSLDFEMSEQAPKAFWRAYRPLAT